MLYVCAKLHFKGMTGPLASCQDSVLMLYQAYVACAGSFTQHDVFLLQGWASDRIDSSTFIVVTCTGATNSIDSIT